eukprot:CAMPEP_0194046340 /NCGR_PEP_ID=MMETSP0009_2-20130614/20872_1 /TAXON_ID=210454 /ORGANISM="Grammatophora oceanica, Strain CCMP 410" /LENGTH=101 /DNA_ID=CAMNT_0038691587 /DNA_START=110 /DNA_END=415 /DNA_ORIENTATION=+
MSQQFFARILNHVMNEVVVKGLAESRMFQRFALRTHNNVQEIKKTGTEYMSQSMDQMEKEMAKNATTTMNRKGPPQPPVRGVPGFFSAFAKEVRKDLGMKV